MSIGSGTPFHSQGQEVITNKLDSHQDRRLANRCPSILKSTEATDDHAKKLSSKARITVVILIGQEDEREKFEGRMYIVCFKDILSTRKMWRLALGVFK